MAQIPELMSGRALEHGIAMMVDHGGPDGAKMYVGGQAHADVAAGTVHTNSLDETALSSYTIPANTLVAGSTIRVRAAGLVVSRDAGTLTAQLKLDTSATAIGAAESIANTTAITVATDDIYDFDTLIQVRTAGSTGTAVAISDYTLNAFSDASIRSLKASFTLDTTAANVLQLTADWSNATVNNQVRSDIFVVDIVNPQT